MNASASPVRVGEGLLIGRLAGLLFLVGAVATISVNQLLDPAVHAWAHLVTALGIASGLLCLLLPWRRIGPGWLHVLPPVASVEVAMAMSAVEPHGHVYTWLLVFIVVFAAYAFESRAAIAAHVAVAGAILLVPIATTSGPQWVNAFAQSLLALPILLVAAAVVVHLRERMTAAARAVAAEARSDALTGAGNYRLLDERLRYELMRHRRNGRPLSVLTLDLDDFKLVNDTLGHPAGDRLLRQVAAVLADTVREQDTVVRQGGDEFCVLAPETAPDEAGELVGRIKHALRGLAAVGEPLSASAGFATFPDDATSAEMLLALADHAQRGDKAAGRGARGAVGVVR